MRSQREMRLECLQQVSSSRGKRDYRRFDDDE